MAPVRLTLACRNTDRTRALADGRVRAEGIELEFLDLPVEEIFLRTLRGGEFDAAEMSISSYVMTLGAEPRPFVAIPAFPSRAFRHSSLYVPADSPLREPSQLAGRRLGVPEYQMTAGVWMRGILQDEHGVAPTSVEVLTGGVEKPGREEKIPLDLPAGFRVRNIGPGRTLLQGLEAGEIDALQASRVPSAFHEGRLRRLFADPVAAEKDYFRNTGIFPIMHLVVIRRAIAERHPGLAQALYGAFCESLRLAREALEDTAVLPAMLPWMQAEMEWLRREAGGEWWPYGLGPNRKVLETFLRYHHEQGLSPRVWPAEELFRMMVP